jgi:hypothetical protein
MEKLPNRDDVIRDVLTRIVSALESLEVGDTGLAYTILQDLELDLTVLTQEAVA